MSLDERIAALTEAEAKMTPEEWETDGGAIIEESGNAEEDIAETIGANRKNNAAGIVALRNYAVLVIAELRAERDRLAERCERMRETLEWCGEQSRLCLLIHSEGDSGRNALSADGGKRASAALAEKGTTDGNAE